MVGGSCVNLLISFSVRTRITCISQDIKLLSDGEGSIGLETTKMEIFLSSGHPVLKAKLSLGASLKGRNRRDERLRPTRTPEPAFTLRHTSTLVYTETNTHTHNSFILHEKKRGSLHRWL